VPPTPVVVDGEQRVVYELHLTNFSADPLTPVTLEVHGGPRGEVLLALPSDELARLLSPLGAAGVDAARTMLAPGMRGVIYLEFPLGKGAPPITLEHRVRYRAGGGRTGTPFEVRGGEARLETRPPVVLGAPLRDGPWIAIHDSSWPRGHRRVFYTIDGRAHLPGRFAIDWVKLDDQGRTAASDPDQVADAYGYAAEVLAVADGVIASVRNDMAEASRVAANPRHALGDGTGNVVSLDLGGGRFAFYEHLKPGSIRVKPGQRVSKGDVSAALGFTGDSTGPHLHFHVADADSPLGAEGVPFVLEQYEQLGRYPDIGQLGKAPWIPIGTQQLTSRRHEHPGANVVVRLP
jgi:hypothetical protein